MSEGGEGLACSGSCWAWNCGCGCGCGWDFVAVLGVADGRVAEGGARVLIGVGEGCGGTPIGLRYLGELGMPGLFAMVGYATSGREPDTGLGRDCCSGRASGSGST
jgi:hypothetical protein